LVIYAGDLENQIRLSRKVKTEIAGLEKNLPPGYFLLKSYDATEYIGQELRKNALRTLFTVVILLLFVLAVSRQFRYMFLIICSLVATLSVALIFYYLFRVEIHLYSLAGITVSLGLILDNSIVMIDHLRHHRNLKVFLATLAATLTTMAALVIVFFLDERVRMNLVDFSSVLIVNLAVSLFVALFLVPALMDKLPLKSRSGRTRRLFFKKTGNKRITLFIIFLYEKMLRFTLRYRFIFLLLIILAFGIPTFLMPSKIEKENFFSRVYNKTFGNRWYTETVKPVSDKILGGSLRLFVQYVFESSFYADPEKTTLYVNAQMPHGSTLPQMNEMIISLEQYLLGFTEIEQFQTSISSPQSARIMILFKKEFEDTGFPFYLKEELIRKAIDLGGADWGVYGIGDGFSNRISESTGSYRITMYGYNYDELYRLAEMLKGKLLEAPRVREVNIMSRNTWVKEGSYEFVMDFDREKLSAMKISPADVYNSLRDYSLNEQFVASTVIGGELERIRLESGQSRNTELWEVKNKAGYAGNTMFRMKDIAGIVRESASQDVCKENQQYRLILAYDYIGSNLLARRHQQNTITEMEPFLPLGYTVTTDQNFWFWGRESKKQYWLLLLICGIIFMICSVLLESLLQPLAIIFMIPVSYIGLFLTFYLFDLNFDQGGFAALVLLSGITVNAALYIINDFNNLRKRKPWQKLPILKIYLKAFNNKIFPILLTIFSTMLGLLPFLAGGQKEVFWPALAAGTIGGLVFSLIGIIVYLPVVLIKRRLNMEIRKLGN
jgi:multidrug efflux pump subunit AcrB